MKGKDCSRNSSTEVEIDMKRNLCIHSMAQLIDITLQSLLYQRQLIPEPVSTMLQGNSHLAEQFRSNYQEVSRILRDTFRTANIPLIAEFVIMVGGTPFSPKELYRIPVPVWQSGSLAENNGSDGQAKEDKGRCDRDGKDKKDECCCAGAVTTCEELTAKERRLVFSAIALSKTAVSYFEDCGVPSKTDKVFLFIRTKSQLTVQPEGLEEDESFELPDAGMQRRRKIHQLRINVHSSCCGKNEENQRKRTKSGQQAAQQNWTDDNSEEEGDENAEPFGIWYRLGPFFTHLV